MQGKKEPVYDRLLNGLRRSPSGCWEWTRMKTSAGYGRIAVKSYPAYCHRVAYELFCGPIPDGGVVCHKCDNPACCHPAHLFLGTHADNAADMVKKGREARGERHGMSKLTADAVREIRARYAAGSATQEQLAAEFGVSSPHICGILAGKFWRHVGGPRTNRGSS